LSVAPVDQREIDERRARPVEPRRHFIHGAWVDGLEGATIDVISPIDGKCFTTLQDGSALDIDAAVTSARAAYESGSWSSLAPAERKAVLFKLSALIEKHALELAVLGVRENGTEISMALKAEAGSAAATFRWYGEAIDKVYGDIAATPCNILGLIHREPVGVIGAIVPWNFPLMIGAWKIAPAIAAGNSVVVKPPESASLSLLRLAELAAEAGLPDGVLNVVTGRGATCGRALALHMDVDVLAFTGSGAVGRQLLEYAAQSNLKRVYLELGGKSPNVIFADAPDLDVAAQVSAQGIFRNSGQVCIAGSRLLVERSIHDEFVTKLVEATARMKLGDPLSLDTDIGAMSSRAQLSKALHHVETAIADGARLICGGRPAMVESGGSYMEPTIFADVATASSLAQNEVFGPVLAVIPFDDEDDAVRIANATAYGLASAVWTANLSRAHRMVRAIRAGVVHVNTYGGADLTVPLGGFRQSGFGRDKSLHAFDAYTNLKTAWISL
jgi:gamma-glutamyl-gamma-aminobutyraldehyde dehydrogenase